MKKVFKQGVFGRWETPNWRVKQDFILLPGLSGLVWFILQSKNEYNSSFEENKGMKWISQRTFKQNRFIPVN